MTWKLTIKGEASEPLPGVPWQEMSDAEFEAASEDYAAANNCDKNALAESGLFESTTEKKSKPAAAAGED
jgi:hypothetical protein